MAQLIVKSGFFFRHASHSEMSNLVNGMLLMVQDSNHRNKGVYFGRVNLFLSFSESGSLLCRPGRCCYAGMNRPTSLLSLTPHFSNIGCECLKIDGVAVPPTLPLSFKLCALFITMSEIANLSSLVGTKSYFPGWCTAWSGPVRDSH